MKYSLSLTLIACVLGSALNAAQTPLEERLTLKNHRFLTLNTVIRVNQIDDGFQRNGFGWVTACWEISLAEAAPCGRCAGAPVGPHGERTDADPEILSRAVLGRRILRILFEDPLARVSASAREEARRE
jgi:hypothetical protein